MPAREPMQILVVYVGGIAAPRSFLVIDRLHISNSRRLSGIFSCALGRLSCFDLFGTGIVRAYLSSDLSEAFNCGYGAFKASNFSVLQILRQTCATGRYTFV